MLCSKSLQMQKPRKAGLLIFARLAFLGAIVYLLISLIGYCFGSDLSSAFSPFSMLGDFRNPFGDMRWILSYADCGDSPFVAIEEGVKCHGYSSPEYPPLFFWLAWRIKLSPDDTPWISVASAISNILLIYFIGSKLIKNFILRLIILAFLYLSFPYQGLLSSANLDMIIFLLVVISGLLVSFRSPLSWLSPLLALFSIGLKLYPLFGFWTLLLFLLVRWRVPPLKKRRAYAWLYAASVSAVSFVTLTTLVEPVTQFVNGSLGSHGLMASGYINNTLISAFGIEPARWMIRTLITCKSVTIIASLVWILKAYRLQSTTLQPPFSSLLSSPRWRPVLIITTAISICCYIFSIGYDYRLVFLFPAIMLIAEECANGDLLPRFRMLLLAQLSALAYIFYLPLFGYHATNPIFSRLPEWVMTSLEVVDEFVMAPFVFTGILALTALLTLSPPALKTYSD